MNAQDELERARRLKASGQSGAAVDVYLKLASEQQRRGDFGSAARTLEQAAATAPTQPRLWRLLSVAAARHRDYASALTAFEKFLRLTYGNTEPSDPAALLAHADLLLMARQVGDARLRIDRALKAAPENAAAHLLAARCASLEDDTSRALAHAGQALAQEPTSGAAWQLRFELGGADAQTEAWANECAALVDHAATRSARIALAYAAGQAFDKLTNYERAFELWQLANREQAADQAARGIRYQSDTAARHLEALRAEHARVRATAPPTAPQASPIFIVGMPRSGTTLTERILAGLPGVEAGGENEALTFIANQRAWDVAQHQAPTTENMTAADWQTLARDYWERSRREPGRVTDKLPHNFQHVGLIRTLFPAASIVYLRRDPRDVCLSIYSRRFPDGHAYATSLEHLAHQYALSVAHMAYWQARCPEAILEVVLENLLSQPVAESRRLANFCGLDWRPECLDVHRRTGASFTFSEQQVREPLNTRGIGRWQHYQEHLEPLLAALDTLSVAHPVTMKA